jgi:uncharacterized protein (DUF433 family)
MAIVEAASINHIVIIDGQPRIASTGLKIGFVVDWVLNQHWTFDTIEREYGLTPAQIHAALSYYYDHTAEIDEWIEYQNQPIPDELLDESRKRREELKVRYNRMQAEKAQSADNENEGQA